MRLTEEEIKLRTVHCPLLDKDIVWQHECQEICFVTEEEWPAIEMPEGIPLNEETKRICLNCENHPDL